MLQIKYDNVFLDLAPNQDCEIERNSPLFLIDNFFAEYSTPITIVYSDSNARALGWYFFQPTVRTKRKFAVEVYDKGTYKCNATLALESAGMNSLHKGASTAGGYLLIGISDFLQAIQSKKLTDLKLGGDRIFNFTTNNAFDGTGGWWQHFHDTWNGSYDYVFAPCRNETWTGSADDPFSTGFMNALDVTTNNYSTLKVGQPVVPFVFVKFVLESIFAESGWKVDFSGLNDMQWEKLLLWSVKPLFISQQTYATNPDTGKLDVNYTPLGQVKIHLADFMPPGYTCAQFISALCLRYGWAPVPSTTTRTCRFIALKEQKNKPAKDWTKYAAATANSQITVDQKIFAFKNDFEGSDSIPSSPDFTGLIIANSVDSYANLPSPASGAYDATVIFVYQENQYYQVITNADNTARIWSVFSDNIYDIDPPDGVDATDTFETKCATLPVYKTIVRTVGGVDWYMWFPTCSQSRTDKFGIKTLLYHGTCAELDGAGNQGSHFYPFASSTHLRHDNIGSNLTWSNVYSQKNTAGVDFGIVPYWFQPWLDIISNVEDQFVKRFYLPLIELLNYKWDDTIVDQNVAYIIKKFVEPLPYKGFIECTMQRISLQKVIASTTPGSDQIVYLRISFENIVTGQDFDTGPGFDQEVWSNVTTCDIIVSAYSDALGTIPLSLTGFAFSTSTQKYKDGNIDGVADVKSWILNSDEINTNYLLYKMIEGQDTFYHTYPSGPLGELHTQIIDKGHFKYVQTLVADASFIIIP